MAHQWHQWPFDPATEELNSDAHTCFNVYFNIAASTICTQLAKAGVSSAGRGIARFTDADYLKDSSVHVCGKLPLVHAS